MSICLWYDKEAEEAARFYCGIFQNSSLGQISRYGKEGKEFHKQEEGTAMTVSFRLNDMEFLALNGGPQFPFTEAISIVVQCDTQEEIDHYWENLTAGGSEGPCGWLKDKYGVSWQIVPTVLSKLLSDANKQKSQNVTKAFLQMKKFHIETLMQAYHDG